MQTHIVQAIGIFILVLAIAFGIIFAAIYLTPKRANMSPVNTEPTATTTTDIPAPSTPTVNFDERGHVIMRVTGLYFIYEHPGQPALETKLNIGTESMCITPKRSIKCVLSSQTLDVLTDNKLVHVIGFKDSGITTIQTLTQIED